MKKKGAIWKATIFVNHMASLLTSLPNSQFIELLVSLGQWYLVFHCFSSTLTFTKSSRVGPLPD